MPDNIIKVGAQVNVAQYQAGMSALVESTETAMEGISGAVGAAGEAVKAVIAAFSAFKGFIDDIKEQVLAVSHLSEVTGISVEKITELKDAFSDTGVSADKLPEQLTAMARAMQNARQGVEDQVNAFRQLGIDTDSWAGKMPDTISVLQQIASHLQHSHANMADLSAASRIFGGDVADLTAFLKENGDSLDKVTRQHLEHGLAVAKSVEAAKKLQQQEAQLKSELEQDALPVLRAVVDAIDGLRIMYEVVAVAITAFGARAITVGSAVVDVFTGMAAIVNDAISGNFKAIPNHARNALLLLQSDIATYNQVAVDQASETQRRIAEILKPTAVLTAAPPARLVKKQDIVDVTRLAQAHGKLADAIEKVNSETALASPNWEHIGQQTDEADEKARAFAADAARITELTNDAKREQAQHNDQLAVGLGYMTEQQAAQRDVQRLETDKSHALAGINSQLTAQIDIVKKLSQATMGGLLGSPQQKAGFQKAVDEYQKLKIQQLEIEKKYDGQISAEQLKLANTATARFRKQMLEWRQLNDQVEHAFMNMLNSMNSNLASFIVEGKANWRQLATSAIETFIQMALQYAESKLTMELLDALGLGKKKAQNAEAAHSSANTAAANTLAEVPFPENIPASTGVLAIGEGFAAAAKFAEGGQWEVPGIQPTILHPQEMVLPAGIASRMRDMVEGRGTMGSRSALVFAPTIHALDAQGVDRVLTKHQRIFENRVDKVLKKKGFFAK